MDIMDDFEMRVRADKAVRVLNAVWLYDEDEECRRLVDESADYGVYAHEALRKQDATLHAYGEDYARAVAPGMADEPMGLVEGVISRMPEERRGVYQAEFDRLQLSGRDTRQDYYGLYGRIVRDEVREEYAARKRAEEEQRELWRQQAQEYERLIAGGMSGEITAPSPEQFELLARGGVPWESIQRARYAAGLAKGDRVNQEYAADLVEGDEVARQLVLQEVSRSSREHREAMEGENYFSSTFWYGPLRNLEHLATKVDRYLPRSSQAVPGLDLTRRNPFTGEVLTPEQQEARRQHRDAFLGDVQTAREAGVAEAEEGIGWKFSHIGPNVIRLAMDLGEFVHPASRAASIAHFAEESYHRNMAAGRSVAMNADEFERLCEEQGWDVAVRTAAQREEAVSMAQVYAKTAVNTLGHWAALKVGTHLVGRAAFTTLPFTRRVLPWLARFNASKAGAFVSSTAATTINLSVMSGISGGINALYECVPGVDEKLDSGLAELSGLWANLGKTQTWVETVTMAGLMGGFTGARHTRAHALLLLRERQGALRAGLTERQFNSVAHLNPAKRDEALLAMVREGMEKDAEGMINRAIEVSRAELDRERALEMRGDRAVQAAMEQLGFSMREADDGVYIHYDGRVGADGVFVPGERSVKVSRADADVYLQAVIGARLEGMARVLRHAAGRRRLLDAFRETLKGEVRVEWMREADNLAKFEGWATRAKERIEVRRAELEADGMEAGAARRAAEGEVHKDISDRGTLGELVSFAKNMRERYEQEVARSGKVIAPEDFGSRANVTRQKLEGSGQLRRLLRIAHDARVHEVAEELGEQVMYDWRESQGMSVTEGYRYLRYFVEWAAKSENPAVAKAAGKLLSLHKTQPELAKRLMSEDFNEHDLTVDEYRAVERELTEAGSRLMLSELRLAAADGNMPMWARELFDMADLGLLELGRDVNLAMALEQARQEGVLPEVAQKLFGVGREAVEAALRAEPEAPEYHRAWYEVQKRQSELDAVYGAGKLTEPSITEEFEARAREGHAAAEREREAEEARAAEQAAERVREFEEAPENEGKSHEEAVREVAERGADAAVERLKGEPGAEADADFAGGRCLEITDEGGLVCKSGLLEVGKLKVLPNFKLGADAESGVVHPLRGDYRPDHDPIRVWRRADGELLVISGRHRLDAAKRAGATRISAYVYEESGARDLAWARRYDIESNIRDNQASPLEVALYVRGEFTDGKPLSNEQVERAGIDREGKLGSIGFRIGRRAGESVMDALRNGKIDDRVALWIADFCPGNDGVQRRGLEAALRDASKAEVLARMEAELALQQMQEEMGLSGGMDLFGNTLDNDAFMDFVARYVVRRRNELAQDASYLNTTAKKRNAEAMGRKYGVDVKDPVALKRKLDELNALRERWKNPYSDGELMDEIRNAWRAHEGAGEPEGAAASVAELPSERLFREYAAKDWKTEGVDYSFTDDAGNLRNLSRAYATDAQGNRLEKEMYITTPQGNLDWYRFPQDKKTQGLLAKHGVKDLPIRLKVGKQESQEHRGFGFLHILNHYDDLMTIGESPLLHLYNTLSNLVKIRGGNGGRYQFKGEYEGGRDSLLIAQLLEDEGCYSMISCYPTQMNRRPQRGELVIGRVLFQFIPSSGEYQIQASKTPSETTTSSVSTNGQVSAGNMPQKLATVNIYDVRIKDKYGEFFRQQYEPTVHFSVIGPKAATWEKYRDRMFTGRDDGMLRAEIDASGARLLPVMKPESAYKTEVKRAVRWMFDVGMSSPEYGKEQRARRLVMITQSSMMFGGKLGECAEWKKLQGFICGSKEPGEVLRELGLSESSVFADITRAHEEAEAEYKESCRQNTELMGVSERSFELAYNHVTGKGREEITRTAEDWEGLGATLGEILDYPELYEAYPALRDVKMTYKDGGASFSRTRRAEPEDAEIVLGTDKTPEQMRGTLLHEVQHLIQLHEDFAFGGSPSNVRGIFKRLGREDELGEVWDNDADYKRLSGEIEARAVVERQYMSADERADRPFNDSLEHEGRSLTYRASEYYAAEDAARSNVTHYSICGLRAKTANEYLEKGADYVDPADGQRKFVIPVAGARLRSDVTPGMMNVPAGGHKDVSLAALLHYPELYRAYPQLAEMRVRLYRPVEQTSVGGYFSPEYGTEQAAYIAVNVSSRLEVLNTLLHESQHAIQALEGFAMGAGSFDQAGALAYLGSAIAQRRAAGVNDDWSRDNMAYLERLHERVEKGSEDAIMMTYLMSHGEQEARYTGVGHGAEGSNPVTEGGLTGSNPSSYTVAVQTQATDLGGVTFLNMGRFGYLMDSRLMPAGEFNYDRRVYQMRENVMRRMRELAAQHDGAEEADGLRLAAEGLAVIDSVEALLPNTYRAALEPYKVYFNTYAKLRGSGDAARAAATVPMRGWDKRMEGAFVGMVYRLISGRAEAEGEFWAHAFADVRGAREGLDAMREAWAEVHEQVAEEYAERLADAPNAKARAKVRQLIEQETFTRLELGFSAEMYRLFQAVGSMRADRLMAKFLERVALQLDAFRKDTTLGRIRRVVNNLTPLPGKDGKPVRGRMAAGAYNKVMDMMRLLELTRGQRLAFERTRYTGEEGCPDGRLVWSELEPDAQITVETYDADGLPVVVKCTKQEYETYACFDGMTASQAESAAKALGEFITTGRQAWENMEELRRQRIAKMCSPLMEKHAETLNDERRRLHSERRGRLPHEKGWLTREGFARRVHSLFGNWMNDAQFFDAMTGVPEVEGFARDFTNRMARAKVYIEAKEKERRSMMMEAVFAASGARSAAEAREFIDFINRTEQTGIVLRAQEPDFLEQETGTLRAQFLGLLRRKTHKKNFSPNTFAAMLEHLAEKGDEVIPEHILEEALAKYGEIGDAEKSRLHGLEAMTSVLTPREFERFRNLTAAAKARAQKAREKWLEEKVERNAAERPVAEEGLELTRSEAAYRVLLCEQADYEETLRRQGYTEAVVQQLREFAGERMMRLAYRLREELGARTPQIKEVYERVYGMPFPEVENYFRAYFNAGYEVHSESIMGGAGEGRAAGKGTAKILYTRHHHNARIDPTMNVLTAFECAMKEQDIMLGYGDLPTDISSVLNFRDGDMRMSEALAKVFSSHTVAEMKTIAENMTRAVPASEEVGRWMTRCLSAMSSSSATAILNYRVGTLFKQRTALFNTLAGSDRVSMWEWYKAAGRVHAGLGRISLKEMAARPELDGRFKGWAAGVEAEAMLGDADVISAKGATNAAARAGMSLIEWIDMRENVKSCAILYDAVYRKMQKEHPELSHEELDADAMNEVRRALAFKSQPLDWRSRSLQATKRSLFTIGNLFLGGESINTMGNVVRLLSRGKKGDKRRAVAVWLQHGMALQVLTALYNWMTDDEEQWERRSWKQYAVGSVLGPLAGLPLVSAVVGMGTGVANQFLPKEWRAWMPTQSLLPMADMERVASDLRKVFWGKKPSSWQDKTIAVENFIRVLATFGILASRNPTSAGGARVKAISYGVAAVTNILDFLLRTERALEERALD